ncbi:hypothetical protein QYE76_054728 [Lolium multiflorum]|uniref:Uncharacterized protein n=1 Tax=Lolium multiflorum TaxID=4521 RepID=A0AAD8SZE7_LOLMU|nr:hypothetical protein QYE76_054728 [Lolium multiflorum]
MARRKPPAQSGAGSAEGQTAPLKRGPWTAEEDELLSRFVEREGEGRWRTLPRRAGLLRCGKSCRLRWMNYLRPDIKRGPIADDEEDLILRLHRVLGNRWSLIAGRLPGRTDNEIKNYWNSHLSKKLIAQGLDPRTHMPLPTAAAAANTAAVGRSHAAASAPAAADKTVAALEPPQPPPPSPTKPTSTADGTGCDRRDSPADGGDDDFAFAATMSPDANCFEGFGDQFIADYGAAVRGGRFDDLMVSPMVDDDTFTSFLDSLISDKQFAGYLAEGDAADHKDAKNDQGGAH